MVKRYEWHDVLPASYVLASDYDALAAERDALAQTEAEMRRRLEEVVADCERLREKLADRIEERDDSNRNLTAALQRESKLQARLAEAEKDATRSRHEWQRECEDTDLLLQGMGLCPSEYRSECGSLLLARIRHKMGHIGLRLDETLARLAEAEALLREARMGVKNSAVQFGYPYTEYVDRIDAFLARENERG